MRIPHSLLMFKLKELGLITDSGNTISYSKFKKMVDVHQYGRGKRRLFIIFVGLPKENLIAFYPPTDLKEEMIKISYSYLVDTIETEMKQEFLDGNIMWGDCGYPLSYSPIRSTFNKPKFG
jgi:hypothetical protein